jgi:hypothetical protein
MGIFHQLTSGIHQNQRMMTFAQLFEESRGMLDNGAFVRSKASEIFSGPPFALSEGLPIVPQRDGVLVGIAFYSLPDLRFLDDIVLRSRNTSHSRDLRIDVFDVLSCKSIQDFDSLFPGITPVTVTPVIGVWRNGTLIDKGAGFRESRRIAAILFA